MAQQSKFQVQGPCGTKVARLTPKFQVQSTWSSPTLEPKLQELPFGQLTMGSFQLPLRSSVASSLAASCVLHKQRALRMFSALGLRNIETCWRMLGLVGSLEQKPIETH